MTINLKSVFRFIFFLSLGLFLIWLVVNQLSEKDKEEIIAAFKNANYFWLIVCIVIGVLSNVSRAMRWQMLLKPLGYTPKTYNTFFAVMIGYLANLAIPRLGEVSRCSVLTKYEKIPFQVSFGTVITERIVDLISLLTIFILTLVIEYEKIFRFTEEKILNPIFTKLDASVLMYTLLCVCVVIALIVFVFNSKIKNSSIYIKLHTLLDGFWKGMLSIKKLESPIAFLFHSILIWALYYLVVYLCFFSLNETAHLSLKTALVLLSFGSVAIIITPGGIGAYPAIIAQALILYNISMPIGYALGWLNWMGQLIQLIVIGGISILLLPIVNKEYKK